MKDERTSGLPGEDGEKYLEDDFEVDSHTPPMLEPWRIEGASVELCGEIAKKSQELITLVNRLRSLYV